mmetsp:Transcript_18327/g.51845  ORF Transcript_18327/g.51845 Transcript_18327/m.51845 type:complete len:210 (-) Transcript_18327:380-1009(-)
MGGVCRVRRSAGGGADGRRRVGMGGASRVRLIVVGGTGVRRRGAVGGAARTLLAAAVRVGRTLLAAVGGAGRHRGGVGGVGRMRHSHSTGGSVGTPDGVGRMCHGAKEGVDRKRHHATGAASRRCRGAAGGAGGRHGGAGGSASWRRHGSARGVRLGTCHRGRASNDALHNPLRAIVLNAHTAQVLHTVSKVTLAPVANARPQPRPAQE